MTDGDAGVASEVDHATGTAAGVSQAPDDEEMPLTEHIEEMVGRLGVVLLVMTAIAAVAFPFADRIINFLWFSFLPGVAENCPPPTGADAGTASACPRVYHPLALMLARLKVATLGGFIVALPVFVYQTYLFMRPGLYPSERRYYLAAVPTSLVLAAVGVAFAFFLVLPAIFTYFLYYSESAAIIAFGLSETFNLMVMMLGLFAFIFQIPLFIMLAIMMGITSRRWLASRRLYFWGGFLTLAFLFSPDPTGMAPILVALTMVVLFEGTLTMLRWTGEGSMAPSHDDVAALRPGVWLFAALLGYAVSPAPVPGGYYDQLPAPVLEAIAGAGLVDVTPILIGGGIIALYELTRYVLARVDRSKAGQVARLRLPVWLLGVVVGYLGSPDPTVLRLLERVAIEPVQAAIVVAALIGLYEIGLLYWRIRQPGRY